MNSVRIIESLKNLKADQKPLWGKMTPQHMVEHLYKTFQASINEIKIDIHSEERRIPVLKRLFLGGKEFPKEFMNPAIGPDLIELEFSDLQSAINQLENIIIRYNEFFSKNPGVKTVHPIFGYLTKEEWDLFHKKHFKHHLGQFGLSD